MLLEVCIVYNYSLHNILKHILALIAYVAKIILTEYFLL